jgi:hypothetical protein
MCSSSSPPPAPDYSGAAQATAAGNLQAAKYATAANRINQYTPYGNLTYTQGNPGSDTDPQWSQRVDLSPVGQQLLNYQNNASLGLGQQTGRALERVDQTTSQPFNLNSAQDAVDKAYGNITSRLDDRFSREGAQLDTQLVNQGLRPGTEAYDNAMKNFNYGKNDAYTQASTQAMNFAPQTFQLESSIRNQPLNELNALRTGSQVTNPQFQNVPMQATTAGPDYLGATQAGSNYNMGLYNAGQAANGGLMSGLFNLGAAGLKAYGTGGIAT